MPVRGGRPTTSTSLHRLRDRLRLEHHVPAGRGHPRGVRTLVAFLDRLDKQPLETGEASLPRLTEGWASTAIGLGLESREAWPDLVDALDAAVHQGDGAGLASFAMDMVERNEDGTYAPPRSRVRTCS